MAIQGTILTTPIVIGPVAASYTVTFETVSFINSEVTVSISFFDAEGVQVANKKATLAFASIGLDQNSLGGIQAAIVAQLTASGVIN